MTITQRIQVWYEDAQQAEIPKRELAVFNNLHEDGTKCLLLTNDLESKLRLGQRRCAVCRS
jgi:hypothetical protein